MKWIDNEFAINIYISNEHSGKNLSTFDASIKERSNFRYISFIVFITTTGCFFCLQFYISIILLDCCIHFIWLVDFFWSGLISAFLNDTFPGSKHLYFNNKKSMSFEMDDKVVENIKKKWKWPKPKPKQKNVKLGEISISNQV